MTGRPLLFSLCMCVRLCARISAIPSPFAALLRERTLSRRAGSGCSVHREAAERVASFALAFVLLFSPFSLALIPGSHCYAKIGSASCERRVPPKCAPSRCCRQSVLVRIAVACMIRFNLPPSSPSPIGGADYGVAEGDDAAVVESLSGANAASGPIIGRSGGRASLPSCGLVGHLERAVYIVYYIRAGSACALCLLVPLPPGSKPCPRGVKIIVVVGFALLSARGRSACGQFSVYACAISTPRV